jgi:hypothetical protein
MSTFSMPAPAQILKIFPCNPPTMWLNSVYVAIYQAAIGLSKQGSLFKLPFQSPDRKGGGKNAVLAIRLAEVLVKNNISIHMVTAKDLAMADEQRHDTGTCPTGGLIRKSILLLSLWTFAAAPALQGQTDNMSQRERLLDEPFRLVMDEQVPTAKRTLFDWGGWFRSSYWYLDERVDRGMDNGSGSRGLRRQQLRLWGNLNIDQVHQFYARTRLDYLDWNHGSSLDHNDSDWEGADLERGWYRFQLSQMQNAYNQESSDYDFWVKIGRQYVEFGNGLSLSVPLDAVLASAYYQDWQLTGLLARSIPSSKNIDRSVPDNTKESRNYWGVQLNYLGLPDHTPFVYYFSQDDQDAGMVRLDQTFGYDSQYLGLGSRGRFFHRDLQYSCEMVAECGKSYAFSNEGDRQNIHAWAFDSELRYLIPDRRFSQLSLGYLLTSGDSDRNESPTNTLGGNRAHTTDTSFSGWGFRDTGLVLAPRPSNLGAIRLGASTFPMNETNMFEKLQIGSNLFLYHKQQAGGAASDTLSTENSSYLGSEVDLYANWQITTDVALAVHYGVFMPGDSFSTQKARQMFFTGMTLSF